ncbi:MAG: GUN4 domain-containing protein [Cyanobacteria bacterium RU_5_0]|nr:GUN4 domain-containing protein [Cyanobacteria bacterium RU_5_0]
MADSHQKYLEIVKYFVTNGKGRITPDERLLLDRQRDLLKLPIEEANAIEKQVLYAYQVPMEKRQPSPQPPAPEDTLTSQPRPVVDRDQTAQPTEPPVDRVPGSNLPESSLNYAEKLDRYRREFGQAIRLKFPPDDRLRTALRTLQRSLNLRDEDVTQVETELTAELQDFQEAQQEKRKWYEEEFSQAIDEQMPFSETTATRLKQLQRQLGLDSDDLLQIERQVFSSKLIDQSSIPSQTASNDRSPTQSADHPAKSQDYAEETVLENFFDEDFFESPPTQLSTQLPPSQPQDSEPPTDRLEPTQLQSISTQPPIPPRAITTLPDYYSTLVDRLQARQWKGADEATLALMLKISDREQEGWLDATAITNFPCEDLHRIDRLWGEHSNEQFSLTIQSRLYSAAPLPRANRLTQHRASYERALAFSKQVKWWQPKGEFYKYYNQLTFSNEAPDGHFPALWFWVIPWWRALQFGGIGSSRGGCSIDEQIISAFMTKLQQCEIA